MACRILNWHMDFSVGNRFLGLVIHTTLIHTPSRISHMRWCKLVKCSHQKYVRPRVLVRQGNCFYTDFYCFLVNVTCKTCSANIHT